MQTVSQVMTRNVQFVRPEESLRRAAQLMDDLNVGALPVCDGERLIGMITDRDITVRATSDGLAPDDAQVEQIMSTDVRWCFEDQPVEEVMRQMADARIRRVPVVSHDDAHRLVGIVALGDFATKASDNAIAVERMVERVSSPAEPDRAPHDDASVDGDARVSSDVATGAGLVGSDVLDAAMNRNGASSNGDPSDVVEVSPEDLSNRHAPDATRLERKPAPRRDEPPVVIRKTRQAGDTSTGASGDPEGIGIGTPAGGSGGTAGTAGSAGTGTGARP